MWGMQPTIQGYCHQIYCVSFRMGFNPLYGIMIQKKQRATVSFSVVMMMFGFTRPGFDVCPLKQA
jgi:hypothetical protein